MKEQIDGLTGPDAQMHQELFDASPDGQAEQDRIHHLLAGLPDATLTVSGYWVGTCVVRRRTVRRWFRRRTIAVVERADPIVEMGRELYQGAQDRPGLGCRVDGDLVTFGTRGYGLGVVSYRVVHRSERDDTLLLKRES